MLSFFKKKEKPYPGEVEEAKKQPNGWVYRIKGDFHPEEAVPREAIVGAWKVDAEGKIVGDFTPNPNHVPTFEREAPNQSSQPTSLTRRG